MRWGANLPGGAADFPRHRRPALWFRQLWPAHAHLLAPEARRLIIVEDFALPDGPEGARTRTWYGFDDPPLFAWAGVWTASAGGSEEHTSELQSLMRISYAVFCLKKKK